MQNLDNVVLSNNDIDLDYINSDIVIFFSDRRMDLVTIDLNSFIPYAKNFDQTIIDDPKTIFRVRLIDCPGLA